MNAHGGTCRKPGFTILELLIVIAIIAVLISLVVPAVGRSQALARRTVCQSNMRQITQAWIAFVTDHDGAMVSSNTGPNCWVENGNTEDAIRKGLLFPYLREMGVYRCASDPTRSNLRTYTLSSYLNGETIPTATRFGQIVDPGTTMVAIEEWDPRGHNINGFNTPRTGDDWIDFPATWHDGGANLSFADGHLEYWQWVDARTRSLNDFYAHTPNNPDLKRLQTVVKY